MIPFRRRSKKQSGNIRWIFPDCLVRVFVTDLLSAIVGNLSEKRQPFYNNNILICFDSLT